MFLPMNLRGVTFPEFSVGNTRPKETSEDALNIPFVVDPWLLPACAEAQKRKGL
eukprot:CAMPEP_0179285604 /NCGR_PEP_ID=MMETSP0797-20121207/39299_1 /TAXON_ID=47934 /ORGANISM="Dinophysis acuminata, Strain DAEP01" /LENGTH=53 /DNA_ID=CAMNT_0020994437 /DNA_START=1 /DNA_END=159 /DNA_ORIENTATION=-